MLYIIILQRVWNRRKSTDLSKLYSTYLYKYIIILLNGMCVIADRGSPTHSLDDPYYAITYLVKNFPKQIIVMNYYLLSSALKENSIM